MGSVLQRKKKRSGRPKAARKPQSKKKILSNPIIAANWNHKETVSQNYRRLGLATKLNKTAGGIEPAVAAAATRSRLIINPSLNPILDAVGEVQVRRDPATGKILEVLQPDGPAAGPIAPLKDALAPLDRVRADNCSTRTDDRTGLTFTQHNVVRAAGASSSNSTAAPAGSVVALLEQAAMAEGPKKIRHQSEQEQAWCSALVARHGDDYGAMCRDGKLNPFQQSAGDIRKRVSKWKQSQAKLSGASDA